MGGFNIPNGAGASNQADEEFGSVIKDQKLVVLGIRHDFEYMDSELADLLKNLVPHLKAAGDNDS